MNIKINLYTVLLVALLTSACRTSSDLLTTKGEPLLPTEFRDIGSGSQDTNSIANIPWRTFFTDTILLHLIDSAIANNNDMRLAVKNIEAAQLVLKQAKAGYLPNIDLQVAANSSRPSDNSLNGISLNQFLGRTHLEDYTVAVSLSWEADIWGKIKNQKAAALAAYLQTEEAKKAIQTQLVAYMASGYYNLLMLQGQLTVAKRNLILNDSTLNIIRQQYEVGEITLLGLKQAQAQRLMAASLIPEFEQYITIQENAISILSGKLPEAVQTNRILDEIDIPKRLAAGVPSLLLSRRPDVKQAELAVLAAHADKQYARANMYPSLLISAQSGVNSFTASNWFNLPASLFGLVAGSVTQPLLQRRQLKTRHQLAQVEQERAVIRFRQSVLVAVGEVADALVALNKLGQKETIALERTQILQDAIGHADLLFNTGMADYLEVITAQSNVLQSELELAQIKKARLDAMVNLYKSLGGGW